MASNSSFHSTQDEFESPPRISSTNQVEREDGSGSTRQEEEEIRDGSKEEIRLLRQALENVQVKLLETRKENRSLQAQLKPEEEHEGVREKRREEGLMESLVELQAKLTDTQERYHQAVEEVEELRARVAREGGELTENQEVQRCTSTRLEHEVQELKAQLVQSGSEQEEAAQQIRRLEEALRRAEEESRNVMEEEQRTAQIKELYKEAQEEIRMLQVDMGFFILNFCRTETGTHQVCLLVLLVTNLFTVNQSSSKSDVFFSFSFSCPPPGSGGSEGHCACRSCSQRLRRNEGGAKRGHCRAAAPLAGTLALLQRNEESAERCTEAAV